MMTKKQAWLIIVMEMLRRIKACKCRFCMAAWLLGCFCCVVCMRDSAVVQRARAPPTDDVITVR